MVETDVDQFDCQTCRVAESLESLDAENLVAWRLYHRIATRVVIDAGLGPAVFAASTRDLEPDAVDALVQRVGLIHDILQPPKPRET